MSIRKVNFVEGEYYHIYNRGNSKQRIFQDKQDYNYFISLLFISNTDQNFNLYDLKRNKDFDIYEIERINNLVAIGAYCLMPNHFHILITEKIEGGISKFMQKLSTAYAMYYNNKYKRTGGLFEGKFKSEHADNDNYLKYLFSYIHLNPIKLIDKDWKEKEIKNKIESIIYLSNYSYSSYLDFIEKKRPQNKIIDIKSFPNYFPKKEYFMKEIFDWLNYKVLR
ncbi:MAG: transposase [Minisyncoccia bacterium]